MKRQENALVAPAALFMGATLVAVIAAVVYFVSGDDDEGVSAGGTPPPPDPIGPEPMPYIGDEMWNISMDGTKSTNVERGRVYRTEVVVPAVVGGAPFSVNITGDVDYTVGAPQISNLPNVGAVIAVTFSTQSNGSIELVWPQGAVPGQQILNFYRRLDFTVTGGGVVA